VWVEPRLLAAQPGHWLGASDQVGLAGSSQPQKKKKEKRERGSNLGFRLSRPKLCLLRVCLTKHTLMPWL